MRFRIEEEIGAGSFGDVFRATRIAEDGSELSGSYALKRLCDQAWDEADRHRFVREVGLMRDKLQHPNVIDVIHAEVDAEPPFFVMPFAESTLERENKRPRAPHARPMWALDTFAAVCAGMAHAHERSIVHRDLKPSNVLIVDGVPRVSDFGLGKDLDARTMVLTESAVALGTPLYRAPEQVADGKRAGTPADVWALGKMLAEMLSGRLPALGPPDLSTVPWRYRDFIARCTAQDPADRFADAVDALASLPDG